MRRRIQKIGQTQFTNAKNMPAHLRIGVVAVEQVKLEKSKVNWYKSL